MGHGAHDHGGSTQHAAHAVGPAAAGDDPGAGAAHAELPPAPAQRHITPAPEDFENLPGPGALLWPVVWMGLGALLIVVLLRGGWPAFHGHGEGPAAGHSTEGGGEPAPEHAPRGH